MADHEPFSTVPFACSRPPATGTCLPSTTSQKLLGVAQAPRGKETTTRGAPLAISHSKFLPPRILRSGKWAQKWCLVPPTDDAPTGASGSPPEAYARARGPGLALPRSIEGCFEEKLNRQAQPKQAEKSKARTSFETARKMTSPACDGPLPRSGRTGIDALAQFRVCDTLNVLDAPAPKSFRGRWQRNRKRKTLRAEGCAPFGRRINAA